MTFYEDEQPNPAKKLLIPAVLDTLGVAELTAYIAALEGEIARVRQAIAAKQAHTQAAAAFFKTPGGG